MKKSHFKLGDKLGYVSPFEESPFRKEWAERREREEEKRREERENRNRLNRQKNHLATQSWDGYGIWFGVVVEEGKQKVTYLYKHDFDIELITDTELKEKINVLKTTYNYLKGGDSNSDTRNLLAILESQTDMALILRYGFKNDLQAEQTSYNSGMYFREIWWGEYTKELRSTPELSEPPNLEDVTYADVTLKQGVRYYDRKEKKFVGGNSAAIIEMAHGIGHFWEIYNLKGGMDNNTIYNIPVTINGNRYYLIPLVEIEIEGVKYKIIANEAPTDDDLKAALAQKYLFAIQTDKYLDTPVFNKDMFLVEYINRNFNGGQMIEWIAQVVQNMFAHSIGEPLCPMVSPNENPNKGFEYDAKTAKYKSKYPLYNVLPSAAYQYRYNCERIATIKPTVIPK